ncbi:NAC domain-containing protein 67 [Senna tora]|uniref:NAC domain-containing protein 67 n=1 Tax=Senna tora TaxID=362788 RepID=A0A835CK42_9FABA|nr:NAC domain-containing protein 67 [Senna tora]
MSLVMPVGLKFLPTDAELVGCYLYKKVTGMALPNGVVFECDLYGKENPWEIWERYKQNVVKCVEGEDLYFFTKLKKKSPKAKRIERRIGIGRCMGGRKW